MEIIKKKEHKKATHIWRVILDRYGDEQVSKSGKVSTIHETFDCFIDKYVKQEPKPMIEVSTIGIGVVFAGLLTERKIPFVEVGGVLMRTGGAYIYKRKA